MIARIWHGYTTHANAGAYEKLLRTVILPGIHRIDGYRGAQLLRRECELETEFITITMWMSMDAVKAFAGGHGAVVPPEAQELLARYDQESVHYEYVWVP
jgi:heme-degrading monooxygenase HmoA